MAPDPTNGWIAWNPSPTKKLRYPFTHPVLPDELVQVKLSTGERLLNSRPARDHQWQHVHGEVWVTAYRVCQPLPADEPLIKPKGPTK
jgi:hypothetical protein